MAWLSKDKQLLQVASYFFHVGCVDIANAYTYAYTYRLRMQFLLAMYKWHTKQTYPKNNAKILCHNILNSNEMGLLL